MSDRRIVAYLAHAISGPLDEGMDVWHKHYADVCKWAAGLGALNIVPYVPVLLPGLSHAKCLHLDHDLVDAADIIVVHDSIWVEASTGVNREKSWARKANKPIAYSLDAAKELKKAIYYERKETGATTRRAAVTVGAIIGDWR